MTKPNDDSNPEFVPLFGTWRNIYVAVIAVNVIAMVCVYLFSQFPY